MLRVDFDGCHDTWYKKLSSMKRDRADTKKATAIPRITSDFHSIDNVGWYGAVYELSITALQPSVRS